MGSGFPILTIVLVSGVVLAFLVLRQEVYASKNTLSYPAFFTTLGILGTFVGISVGLWNFDPGHIEKSLPQMMDALKTAFWVSIAGIVFALFFKLQDIRKVSRQKPGELPARVTINELAIQLERIHKALAGEEDSTLLSQIKLMRQDTNDKLDGLIRSQDSFMKNMSDRGAETLVRALEEVIRNFDDKINSQLGESFHQLNEVLGKVLTWQESYHDQMMALMEQQKNSTLALESVSNGFTVLNEESQGTRDVLNHLDASLREMVHHREAMEKSLTALAGLLAKASDGIPTVEKKILELANQMSSSVQTTTTMLASSLEEATKRAEVQINALDKALEAELTRSLASLGQQLTALSRQFVEDYTPLTGKLKDLVAALGKGED